jgi:hypothetical protein
LGTENGNSFCKTLKHKNMYITITLKNGKTIKDILTGISKTHIEINHGEFIPISMLKQDFLHKL